MGKLRGLNRDPVKAGDERQRREPRIQTSRGWGLDCGGAVLRRAVQAGITFD
jgi:hypothetical protein